MVEKGNLVDSLKTAKSCREILNDFKSKVDSEEENEHKIKLEAAKKRIKQILKQVTEYTKSGRIPPASLIGEAYELYEQFPELSIFKDLTLYKFCLIRLTTISGICLAWRSFVTANL